KPQRLRKYVASHPRSLKIACVIHTSRDAQTAVYKNTNERVQYLQGLGHHCTIITPEDFPLLRQVDGRFIPLVYPILVARWLARHSDIDVALFHSYAGCAVTFAKQYLGLFGSLRTAIVFHGLEPLYYSRLKQHAKASGNPLSWRYRFIHGRLMMGLLRSST